MLEQLERLTEQDAFWDAVREWVQPEHIERRRAYYEARFGREMIAPDQQLFWLVNEFYGDAAFHDPDFRQQAGAPPLEDMPFPSRVDFDDFLASIDRLRDWPVERMVPFVEDAHDAFTTLMRFGAVPADKVLDRLKDYARCAFNFQYRPPILPLTWGAGPSAI